MSKNISINYYETLIFVINLSGLSIEEFAKKANISLSLISHADESWNPKYSTVEKICSVVKISVTSFFNIAENLAGVKESITMNYVSKSDKLTPIELCEQLKDVRKSLQISEAKLAKLSGINKTNICNREHGKIKTQILCSTLEKYAASFGLSMSGLTDKLYNKNK